jgi:beta-lactamase class D
MFKKLVILGIIFLPLILWIVWSNASKNSSNSSMLYVEENNENSEKVLNEDLSKYFSGYEGCFVLYDKNENKYLIYNEVKSEKEISPCSTFKIVHALIGLDTNVLKDENTIFKWNGTKYAMEEWNKYQTLLSAVANSVVWYFQEVASKVGEERMQEYLSKIDYGNKDISGGLTNFWLQSSLKISPRKQVELLRNMYDYKLPFSKRNIDIVKKILKISEQNGIVLLGKTGSGMDGNKSINGWFIDYVERNNDVFFFAVNIEGKDGAAGVLAEQIAKNILKDKNIL